jgi:hypothetical protein
MYSICARVQRVVRAVLERSQGWLVHARTPTSRLRVSSEDRESESIDRSIGFSAWHGRSEATAVAFVNLSAG